MKKIWLIVLVITFIAGGLRFIGLTSNPPSLNIDEVSYGYDAYSILKTGRDQYGNFMPLVFRSVGDYKNPTVIYTMVPSIAVFGLNEWGVRFPTALLGTLSIPLMYMVAKRLLKNEVLAVLAAGLLAISPWHIYYSRLASDHLIAVFFLLIGVGCLEAFLDKKRWWWLVGTAAGMSLSIYTYHAERLFIPVFVVGVLIIKKKLWSRQSLSLGVLCSLLLMPLGYQMLFGQANIRLGMVFITQDIEYTRYIILDHMFQMPQGVVSWEMWLLPIFWLERYGGYWGVNFLLFNGLNMTKSGFGLGVIYIFEFPILVCELYLLVKKKLTNWSVLVWWLVWGFVPSSLTNNVTDAGRSLLVVPAQVMVLAVGAIAIWRWLLRQRIIGLAVMVAGMLIIVVELIRAMLVFRVHFMDRADAFMAGSKQSVEYALAHQNEYKEIVFDPKRGADAGDVINIPHMYILFYSQYDPKKYQLMQKNFGDEIAHFDRYTVRAINWQYDRNQTGVLFIGSPWSVPLKDLKPGQLKGKFFLPDGRLVLVAVTP